MVNGTPIGSSGGAIGNIPVNLPANTTTTNTITTTLTPTPTLQENATTKTTDKVEDEMPTVTINTGRYRIITTLPPSDASSPHYWEPISTASAWALLPVVLGLVMLY